MSFFGSDTTKTDTSVTSSTVSSPSAVGGNGSVLAIEAAGGKGSKVFNVNASNENVDLGALALADNFAKDVTDIFKTGSNAITGVVAAQADYNGNGGAVQGSASFAPYLPASISSAGLVLTTPMKIGLAIAAAVLGFLLLRRK